jgi:hypothetical protein
MRNGRWQSLMALVLVALAPLIYPAIAGTPAYAGTMITGTAAKPPAVLLDTITVFFVDTSFPFVNGSDIDIADSLISVGGVNVPADGNPAITGPTLLFGVGSATWTLPAGTVFDPAVAYSWTLYYTSPLASITSAGWEFDSNVVSPGFPSGAYYGPGTGACPAPCGINFADTVAATPTTAPIPPALFLFVTGLGALGLFGWRRNRKAGAIATA